MGQHKFKKGGQGKPSSRHSRHVVTTVIILVVVIGVIGIDLLQRQGKPALANFVPQRTRGEESAPIKIVEFLDFQCSHCKEGSVILKDLMVAHPQKIQLTLKYFPLGQLNSSMSAYYAECAARQGKFWELVDKMLATQDEWRTLLKIKPFLDKLVSEAGVDQQKLNACVDSKSVKKTVAADEALGESYQVRSTPTYFINGEMVVGIHSLEKTIAELLGKQAATVP